jgi:C4-dicarboxylate-binding protein DctP
MARQQWICAFLASLLLMPGSAGAQQVKLRASVQVEATDPFLGTNLMLFKEEVERQTGKAITVEIFDKGQLYNDQQVVGAVASGKIEMGIASLSQFTRQVPAIVFLQQPFLFNFEALVRAAVRPDSAIRKLMDQAVLDAVGVRTLWWLSFGSAVIVSKGVDVRDPDRIRKQKIRVFSEAMAELTKLCGGTPAVLSSSRMHDALKDGTVDMVMTGIGACRPRQRVLGGMPAGERRTPNCFT